MLFRVRKLDYQSSTRDAIIIKDTEKKQGAFVAYEHGIGNERAILIETEKKKFGEQLLNEVAKLISLDRTTLMVSADGKTFLSLEELQNAWQHGAGVIHKNGEKLNLLPYQQYLNLNRETLLFEDDVDKELLKLDPNLRYATTKETVISLIKGGHIEKAIRNIPIELQQGSLAVAISTFRAAQKDYNNYQMDEDKFTTARGRFINYILNHWEIGH